MNTFDVFNDVLDVPIPYQGTAGPDVAVFSSDTGQKQAFLNIDHDLKTIEFQLVNLTRSERDAVREFYNKMKGPLHTFLWYDPSENFFERQLIAKTDGTSETKIYQYPNLPDDPGFRRWNIELTDPAPEVWLDGVLQVYTTDYTIQHQDSGIIDWVVTPSADLDVEIRGRYYRRMRFTDLLSDTENMWNALSIPIVIEEEIVDA